MAIRLGLDASQLIASCAVSAGEEIVAKLQKEKPIENFPVLIRKTISQAHISLADLDEIIVCIGPGSQTGVRAAVVTGNALAMALGLPISGVLSTDAGAALLSGHESKKIAVSAGKTRWYVEEYQWENQQLQRMDVMQLLEDIPADALPVFKKEAGDSFETESCAEGVLIVAREQRHLISQSLVEEIIPYERGEGDGR